MKNGSFIGINFGTTNTAVVQLLNDEQGYRTVNLGEGGEYPFSSIVAIPKDGGKLKFGRKVRDRREELTSKYEIFTSMKSYLGTDREFIVGSNSYSAMEITTEFFKSIKEYIVNTHGIEIKEAGLSFPSSFTPDARRELRVAVERAGIAVKSFISEPTAAYFSNRKAGQAYSRVMVLDWGGGTFDISILNLKKGSVSEATVFGDNIGGDDIDIELARCIHAEIVKKSKAGIKKSFDDMSPTSRDLMIARCERAKIEISETDEEYDITIMDYDNYGTKSLTISVDLFNDIVKPIIKSKILKAIDSALGRANIMPTGIDAVVIVGGSSNLSPYQDAITHLFGENKIILPAKPQWSTAEGAALMQIIGGNFKLNDSLGVFLSDGSVMPLLKANEDGVGTQIGPLHFSLVEDSPNAHFVFSNGDGNIIFERVHIPTKGFLNEVIKLNAEISDDQIAKIEISNSFMGNQDNNPPCKIEINKLTFYYDISELI